MGVRIGVQFIQWETKIQRKYETKTEVGYRLETLKSAKSGIFSQIEHGIGSGLFQISGAAMMGIMDYKNI